MSFVTAEKPFFDELNGELRNLSDRNCIWDLCWSSSRFYRFAIAVGHRDISQIG